MNTKLKKANKIIENILDRIEHLTKEQSVPIQNLAERKLLLSAAYDDLEFMKLRGFDFLNENRNK
ncbi:MAG: hypothetical protein QQN41_10370 [Nitrosopumilus sp.]